MIGWLLGNLKLVAGGIGAILLAVAIAFIRKSGADAEKLKQAKADIKAANTISEKRTEARGSSDAQLDERIARWTRK